MVIECENLIGLRIGPLHPGRTDRHSRNTETQDGWFFFQQALDNIRRNVTLDDVTIDEGRVAGKESIRNFVLRLYFQKLAADHVFLDNLETVRLQVAAPARATTSAGILKDGNGRRHDPRLRVCHVSR